MGCDGFVGLFGRVGLFRRVGRVMVGAPLQVVWRDGWREASGTGSAG